MDTKASVTMLPKKCVPCEGGTLPLTASEAKRYLNTIRGWELVGTITVRKEFIFRNFKEALAFVNEVGLIAEREGHHPDIHLVSYKRVIVELTTHAVGGLSLNDFVLASKIGTIHI